MHKSVSKQFEREMGILLAKPYVIHQILLLSTRIVDLQLSSQIPFPGQKQDSKKAPHLSLPTASTLDKVKGTN